MKNKIILVFFTMVSLAMTIASCNKDKTITDATEESKISNKTCETVSTQEENSTLHFVDAHGQWYDTLINPNVAKHEYDWQFLQNDGQNISYVGDDRYTIRKGVDVSKYQGDIDWNAVRDDGYEFAIIRIAFRGYGQEGMLKEDDRFKEYIDGAKEAGLDVGVYIFSQAIDEEEAIEEAEFVIELLDGIELELPITFDPELIRDDEARTDDVTGEQFAKNTLAFCDHIRSKGYEPMVYSNMYWEAFLFDMEKLEDIPIWYADYEKIPQTPYSFKYWQYTEKGKVDGIQTPCDIDIEFCENNSKE